MVYKKDLGNLLYMKTMNLFGVLTLLLATFCLISCEKEDEVNISQLVGKWSVTNDDPNLSVDGLVQYTFSADKSCSIYCYDALSNKDTTINRRYAISIDNRLITMYKVDPIHKENGLYTEQYYIRKLTSNEMKWENASPKDGNSDKKLVKVKE